MEPQPLLGDLFVRLGVMSSSQLPPRVWVITRLYTSGRGIGAGKPFVQNQELVAELGCKRRSVFGYVTLWPSLWLLYPVESSCSLGGPLSPSS